MSKELIFEGPFKDVIPQYIEYKKALGYAYNYDYSKRLDPTMQIMKRCSFHISNTSEVSFKCIFI